MFDSLWTAMDAVLACARQRAALTRCCEVHARGAARGDVVGAQLSLASDIGADHLVQANKQYSFFWRAYHTLSRDSGGVRISISDSIGSDGRIDLGEDTAVGTLWGEAVVRGRDGAPHRSDWNDRGLFEVDIFKGVRHFTKNDIFFPW